MQPVKLKLPRLPSVRLDSTQSVLEPFENVVENKNEFCICGSVAKFDCARCGEWSLRVAWQLIIAHRVHYLLAFSIIQYPELIVTSLGYE